MNGGQGRPTTIFFDESGFTGGDLLNTEQPIFCVGSTIICDEVAKEVLRRSFPDYQGPEVKFRNVWSSWKNKRGLVRFSEAIAKTPELFFAYFVDKKFCVLTKFVDFLIEPVLHDAGYDFYANGYAPRFCNRFKFGLDQLCEPELFDCTVANYQAFAMNPTPQALDRLEFFVRIAANSVPSEVRDYYEMACIGIDHFRAKYDFSEHQKSNEIQLTTVLASVAYWRQKLDGSIAVIHDQSSNFFRQADLWKRITRPTVAAQFHNAAGGGSFPFPLGVVSTTSGNSRDHAAIQVCDVISGLVALTRQPIESSEERGLLRDVMIAGFGELICDGIRPEEEFVDGPPEKLGGPDAVDQMRNIIFGPDS
jgi:hypothetical protein